ncbi:MAG: aminotransferase class III-fold pyridoxal phosphate-dependent enzyme [Actinomycetales bacterium]
MTAHTTGLGPVTDVHARRNAMGRPLLPGGYGRSAYHVGGRAPYAVRGAGWRLWDDSGREIIDANGNFTTLVHGNAHPVIVEAAEKALRDGASWGVPNLTEWDLAEVLLQRLPGLGQVRFTNSGTEAVMSAIRVARAVTGRDGVIMTKDGYHGSSDVALLAGGPSRGVPTSTSADVDLVPLNDVAALRSVFEAAPQRHAALVLDLLPNKAGLIEVSAEFVDEARKLTTRYGALLIIDEVISLRLGINGLSGVRGVVPDLLTAGKIIGGGFAIGAVAGRDEVMEVLDPWTPGSITHSGTFSGNPVSTAAGAAALRLLTADQIDRLNTLGDDARVRASQALTGTGWQMRGYGSLLRPFLIDAPKVPQETQQRLWWAAYERGVALSSANLAALSTPMDSAVVADLTERLVDAVKAIADR